ncbi:MAG: CPBP family intramembrane metalloprotease [Bacteroidales bacterium]|nr:CPBP family intramembrane metalloprotease [Bacteroidales bacterium]
MRYSFKNVKYFVPNVAESWLLTAIFLLVGSLGVVALVSVLYKAGLPTLPQSVIYLLSMVPVIWWILARGRRLSEQSGEYVAVDSPSFGPLGPVWTLILLLLVLISLSYVVEPLYSWIPMSDRMKELFEKTFGESGSLDLFLAASVLAPLCEEFLCRGTILRGLLCHTTPVKAILLSAFIFAFIHMNPWQSIPAFIVGCFIGWVYYRTHSFWACVFIHFANNTFSQIMGLLLPDAEVDDTFFSILPHTTYYILYGVLFAVTVVALYILNKKLTKKDEETVSFEVHTDSQE